jgi:hypothetical protein
LMDAPPQKRLRFTEFIQYRNKLVQQFVAVIGTTISEFLFQMIPDSLIGIQVGRISRKPFKVQTRKLGAQVANQVPFMGPTIIQKNDHLVAKVPKQMAQEFTNFPLLNILRVKLVIQPQPFSSRTDRNTGDRRDSIATVAMAQDGRLTAGCPGLANRRDQEEARLVNKDEVGAQPRGLFFILGQSSRFQRSTSSSSHSTARRSGFWWLQDKLCIRRPIWSRWYLTPNFFSTSSAIRWVVHKSVRYPWDGAPWSRYRTRRSFCLPVSLGGRPGVGLGCKASSPPCCNASRHLFTELALQPILRAISLRERSCSKRIIARLRRLSNSSGDPLGRIESNLHFGYSLLLHYLCRSQ